jgi:hypothetical protein
MTQRKHPVGRPAGAATVQEPPVVDRQPPSKCPTCGGVRRSNYWGRHVQKFGGVQPDGRKYSRIVKSRCRCLDCGQVRIDRAYEA